MEFGERSVGSRSHRAYFIETISEGEADWMDIKLVLALACERSVALQPQTGQLWAGLVQDMAQCRFEGEDGLDQLRMALSTRLTPPPPLDEPMERLCVRALEALDFPRLGL